MTDMLTKIYEQLVVNPIIAVKCLNRIKYYNYPETADTDNPFIIIIPLDVPIPYSYGSDTDLSTEFIYQIDVQSKDRKEVKIIQQQVKAEMKKLKFKQMRNGLDEYFEETGRYVDARRYTGVSDLYDTDY